MSVLQAAQAQTVEQETQEVMVVQVATPLLEQQSFLLHMAEVEAEVDRFQHLLLVAAAAVALQERG